MCIFRFEVLDEEPGDDEDSGGQRYAASVLVFLTIKQDQILTLNIWCFCVLFHIMKSSFVGF